MNKWLANLPAEWASLRLKYCVRHIDQKVEQCEGSGTYVGLENIEPWTGRHLNNGTERHSEGESRRFTAGDVLFGKLRPYLAKCFLTPWNGLCTSELLVLQSRLLEARYLQFLMLSREWIEIVNSSTYGAKMPRANWEFIGNLRVPLPSRDEQRLIADFLDRETVRIDELIAKKGRLIEVLAKYTNRLVHELTRTGPNADLPMKDTGVDWLGRIPITWKIVRIGELAKVVRGSTPRPAGDPRFFYGDVMPWVTVGEITKDESPYLEVTESMLTAEGVRYSRIFSAGTLLLTNSGATLGVPKLLKIAACANDGVIGFETVHRDIEIEYLYLYLSSCTEMYRDRTKQGAGQPNLNTRIVSATPVPLPSREEQQNIISLARVRTNTNARLAAKVRCGVDKLREYRSALISAAVTGQIDVRTYRKEPEAVLESIA